MNPENTHENNGGDLGKGNFGPNDRIASAESNNLTPKDHPLDGQRVSSQRYREIKKAYMGASMRETMIQVIGVCFVGVTLILEMILYLMMQRLANRNLPANYFVQHTSIFALFFAVGILATIQLVIIGRWNKKIKEGGGSLAKSQYMVAEQINGIRIILVFSIFLLLVFLILLEREFRAFEIFMDRITYNQSLPDFYVSLRRNRFNPTDRLKSTWNLYLTILRASQIISITYFIVELRQLFVWTRKLSRIRAVEAQILSEMPEMDELLNALQDDY